MLLFDFIIKQFFLISCEHDSFNNVLKLLNTIFTKSKAKRCAKTNKETNKQTSKTTTYSGPTFSIKFEHRDPLNIFANVSGEDRNFAVIFYGLFWACIKVSHEFRKRSLKWKISTAWLVKAASIFLMYFNCYSANSNGKRNARKLGCE